MPRTALTPTALAASGATVSAAAANADGHTIPGTGDVFLLVVNGSGGSINVTAVTPSTQDGLAVADQVVAVGAGASKLIGPFAPRSFTDETDNLVDIDFSAVTTITCQAFQV